VNMLSFFKKFSKLPSLREFPLKAVSISFSLDRLVRGVDNVRYDVYLSPDFRKTASQLVSQVVALHTRSEEIMSLDKASNLVRERDEFKRLCREIMLDGINKAKLRREIQIDYLAQAAIIKLLTGESRARFEKLLVHLKSVVRECEVSGKHEDGIRLKKELTQVTESRKSILQEAGRELFQYVTEVRNKDLKDMRESNFGADTVLPDYVFSNPMLHMEDMSDDFFIMEEYDVLMGHRMEDPDNHDVLTALLRELLTELELGYHQDMMSGQEGTEKLSAQRNQKKTDALICHADNIDRLMNCFETKLQRRGLKKRKADKSEIAELAELAKKQKNVLNFFYRTFKKRQLLQRIVALYEMLPVYRDYCPPLVPQLVLQYLIYPKSRKNVRIRLRRLKNYYGKSFSLRPLRKLIIDIEKIGTRKQKEYLIRFLRGFARYHRDFINFTMIREATECINLATEEKIIDLSRANNALYEFLLPSERESGEKPVINHVIIKADVRGSTDIVHKMKAKRLNPATHFSLNFFDPITDILPEYGAIKVCIEGDAYILAIYEREDTPDGWYSVARACGLALNMLSIIRRYNAKNRKYQLPELELGIGITFRDNAPTIFFDGEHQIMISSAINLADRLSGCSKALRRKMEGKQQYPFNLRVFQTASDADVAATADDLSLRYNVNGIELGENAFHKLSEEIDMKPAEIRIQKQTQKFHMGKFPSVGRRYQELLIRESPISRIEPDTLEITETTSRNYYEVCTNTKLYEHMRKLNI